MINNQFPSAAMVKEFNRMTGIDVTPMLDAEGKLDEIEAIHVGAELARVTNMAPTPNAAKFTKYMRAYRDEIEAGTVDPKDLETLSGLPEPVPQGRRSDAGEPDAITPVALVVPGTDEVFIMGGEPHPPGELIAHTGQVNNKADFVQIFGHDLDGIG